MWRYIKTDELYHHGVLGMKWGVRRYQNKDGSLTSAGKKRRKTEVSEIRSKYDKTKAARKQAEKQFSKDYNKAYNYSSRHPISQYISKKRKAESDSLWEKANKSYDNASKANKKYYEAKQERKNAINKQYKKIQKNATLKDKMLLNNAGRKAIAKYMVDNNMSMDEAKKKVNKQAVRNSLLLIGGSLLYGAGIGYLINKKL